MKRQNQSQDYEKKIQKKYKIYIDWLLPYELNKHLHKFNDVLNKTKKYAEFVTDNGIYIVEGNENLYKLKILDVPMIRKEHFLIDKSIIKKEKMLSQIPYHHVYNKVIVNYYGNSADIQLVIENLENSGKKLEPTNFYFLANEYFNFENPLNAEELEWFLSVLK